MSDRQMLIPSFANRPEGGLSEAPYPITLASDRRDALLRVRFGPPEGGPSVASSQSAPQPFGSPSSVAFSQHARPYPRRDALLRVRHSFPCNKPCPTLSQLAPPCQGP